MKEITLSHGLVTLVDDEDFETLKQYSWWAHPNGHTRYALRHVYEGDRRTTIGMHRQIMNAPKGAVVDHMNHNGLDNRRENLRICTPAENGRNSRPHSQSKSSRFKGVYWNTKVRKWRAEIQVDCARIYLGTFNNEFEAANAYDHAAMRCHGEFAWLNFPLAVLVD